MPAAKKSPAKKLAVAKEKPARKAAPKSPAKSKTKPTAKSTPKPATKPKSPAAAARSAERLSAILRGLDEAFPAPECALIHRSPWELLVATILSAQCTDARVNMVTPALFDRFPTPQAFAQADVTEIEALIRSTGFFHNKAKSILGAAQKLITNFSGQVPQTLTELTTLPGAARKTASVVLGVCFNKAEGVVVDTHVLRISRRLSLATSETPEKVEQELMAILPHERWISFSHQIIHHGRKTCIARKPLCHECNLEALCTSADKTWRS